MAGKKTKGIKRHIVVDTQGNILHVKVHAANIHDTIAGCEVMQEMIAKYPSIKGVCADAGYRNTMKNFVKNVLNRTVDIVERITPGWSILPRRWVVERTFAWLNHFNRLAKDFEITVHSAENTVIIAHSIVLLRRACQS